jgi:DNA-directed RNA polymerase specialized sigma24 family protein
MPDSPRLFPTTSRTLIQELNAPDQRTREMSLARFCTQYYPAIYGYARALGMPEADAKDRGQDFFVEVVRDGLLGNYDLGRGSRLSSWLMKCFKNLVSNHHAANAAQKRGGGREFVPFDSDHAEHSFRAAHLAHLDPGPTFDLMLAREIWLAARGQLLKKHTDKGNGRLVADLLPFTLMERWPQPPMPTQEELATRHDTTIMRLKAFFNRTLRLQARLTFDEEAQAAAPGIDGAELDHLWHLLCRYGET